jgi:AmmeMemoRadiSam system protein A
MEQLVKLARKTIEGFFKTKKLVIIQNNKFKEKRGVFVTIDTYPENELRGCVGFSDPIYSVNEAVQRAAVEAAFHDGRFLPLKKEELANIVFEVSLLSLSEEIKETPEKIMGKIKEGDGLIIECGMRKGLFLPQVWEQIPDKKQFLEQLCWKAGLTPDYILDKSTKLYKFNVKAFKETKPKGKVIEVKI